MTQIENDWGADPGDGYEALAAPLRPIFAEIAASAAERDLNCSLPHDAIRHLKESYFGAVRVPVEVGGKGASLPQFFNLLIELSAADSSITQALRGHFGFTQDILSTKDPIEPQDIVIDDERFKYSAAFYQLVHLATLAGIGRAITADVAKAVAERRRTYTHAAAARSSEDPQVLQAVDRIRAAAYAAGAIILQAAASLERAFAVNFAGDPEAEKKANAIAEREAAQAQTVVSDLIFEVSTLLFDALGASATKKPAGLDRRWRNARTLASHNPRIYKHRTIGDFAVNGTPPPYQWRIGASAG